jgi:hypothetical protein
MRKSIFLSLLLSLVATNRIFSQVVISEVCTTNGDLNYDPDFFNFSNWIELYNPGDEPVILNGYSLTDETGNPTQWMFPAGTTVPKNGYLLVWCDEEAVGLHTDFEIDPETTHLTLRDASGSEVSSVRLPTQYLNISYAASGVGQSSSWQYSITPTPGASNVLTNASRPLEDLDFSVKAGTYMNKQTVTISHSRADAMIRYTLDGSEPVQSSLIYEHPVVIDKTSVLKAKAFHSDFLPSLTEVKTYFINERSFTLPIVSLTINPTYLYDDMIGIYVMGKNGKIGNGLDVPSNWNQNWFRHADFEYFKPGGERITGQSVDVRIFGNWSRRKPQKSFSLKARDKYGNNTVDYKLFPNKSISKFGSISLRNSGTDWNLSLFRDALMQNFTIGQLDLDYLDYQPAVLYLNGAYWGIQNLRERVDPDYFKANFGIRRDDLDLMEGRSAVLEGTGDWYSTYRDSLERRVVLSDPASFKFIDRYIDVQNFINYQVANIYIANTDWPSNNVKYWRRRSTNGKMRWILWDCDFGFGVYADKSYPTLPSLEYATDPDNDTGNNRPWATLHLRLLLQNPVFKQRFIQTLTTSMQTTFKPDRLIGIIDMFYERVKPEVPYHKEKWGGKFEHWETEIERIREFARLRNPYMRQHTIDFFGLKDEVKLDVSVTPVEGGEYVLNGVESDKQLEDAYYFKGLPFAIAAKPKAGYRFKEWKVNKRNSTNVTTFPMESEWKYSDKGGLSDATWMNPSFDDNSWPSANGQFGYGDGDEKKVVGFGSSSSNKHITTYFRKEFQIRSIVDIDQVVGSVLFDDGVVVYLNGNEIVRQNLPLGTISSTTLATAGSENKVHRFAIDKALFVEGENTIAVEVHQVEPTSSDLSFDMTLSMVEIGDFEEIVSNSIALSDTAYSDVKLEATFEQINGVVINEFSAQNSIVKDNFNEAEDWIELHNLSDQAVDVAGFYVTDDLNDKTKYKIPSGSSETIISPGGYLLLWADDDKGQGITHTNFRLADAGESIGLYKLENSKVVALDEIIYSIQEENQSWARSPNATGAFTKTFSLTPGRQNPRYSESGSETFFVDIYPNPTTGILFIDAAQSIDRIIIFDSFGREVHERNSAGTGKCDLSSLGRGSYFVKVQSGTNVAMKRIVKE